MGRIELDLAGNRPQGLRAGEDKLPPLLDAARVHARARRRLEARVRRELVKEVARRRLA